MNNQTFTVSITVDALGNIREIFKNVVASTTIDSLLILLKERLGPSKNFNACILRQGDKALALETQIRQLDVESDGTIEISLTFFYGTKNIYPENKLNEKVDDYSWGADVGFESVGNEENNYESEVDEASASETEDDCEYEPEPEAPPISNPRPKKEPTKKIAEQNPKENSETRLTVRYYSTMNPEMMFPLTVTFSPKIIERIKSKKISQVASNKFKFNVHESLKIEPMIPGCQCYPPKQTIMLNEDASITFYVAPQVVGKIQGAFVRVLQNNIELEKVKLQVQVKKKTLVILSGFATFLLPGISTILKLYDLDFENQKAQGFSMYITLMRFVFDYLSPWALMAGLCGITTVSWLWATPREEELFWDMKKVGPEEIHADLLKLFSNDYDAAWGKLVDLMTLFPTFLPALETYAVLHYKSESFKEALLGFENAMAVGTLKPSSYLRAGLCASKLTLNEKALAILTTAVKILPEKEIPADLHYNMACYHARLGQLHKALLRLKISIAKGFNNISLLKKDPDFIPLRGKKEFQELMAILPKK